ncbi:MAG: DNA-binding protein [Alphaproteobacteria bacterium PA4]|nr:MAG: DNA-binding protein [Alphaproteobacteria bacterium PA4]
MRFVDTCTIIDLQMPAGPWHQWAVAAVASAAAAGPVIINHVVLAELLSSPDPARARLHVDLLGLVVDPLDAEIAARAGAAQRLYRSRGGPRVAMIADFLIGAHAVVRAVPLITRDRQRFARYFPELDLIAPEDHS